MASIAHILRKKQRELSAEKKINTTHC